MSAAEHVEAWMYFWGAKGAPVLFSEIEFCMASCSYIQCKLQNTIVM